MATTTTRLSLGDLYCTDCGGQPVMAVMPGTEEERTPLFLLRAGEPRKQWCEPCWMRRWGVIPRPRGATLSRR